MPDVLSNTNTNPETIPEATLSPLPLQDDVAYALQRGQYLAIKAGKPVSDEFWLIGALASSEAFSSIAYWWKHLGLESPSKKGRVLFKIQCGKNNNKPGTLDNLWRSTQRFFLQMFFLDLQEERKALQNFASDSELYKLASTLAHSENTSEVSWKHWFISLRQLHPEWLEMLGLSMNDTKPHKLETLSSKQKANSGLRTLLFWGKETLQFILIFQVLTIGIRQGLGEFRLIPSGSMEPTLQIGDRIFIEKPTKIINAPYNRGDILVFVPPGVELNQDAFSKYLRISGLSGFIPPINNIFQSLGLSAPLPSAEAVDLAYIKRLVALPGDYVQIIPGEGVYINGELLDEPFKAEVSETCTIERPFPICEAIQVPPGHVFMLGDNRNSSHDSRYWHFLPVERIIGRAVFRFWPVARISVIGNEMPAPPNLDNTVILR